MIGLIRRLSVNLSRNSFFTIYIFFIRLHLDYCDILYDKSNNETFQNKMEKIKYRACIEITGGIQGTSRQQRYDELDLHLLVKRLWHNKLVKFYKIVNPLPSDYFYSYLDFFSQESYLLRSSLTSIIRPLPTRTKSFKRAFFPYCVNEWNKLEDGIRNAKSINIFKKSIISEKKTGYFLFMIYLV